MGATTCKACPWPVAIASALVDGLCQPCRLRRGETIAGHRLVSPLPPTQVGLFAEIPIPVHKTQHQAKELE